MCDVGWYSGRYKIYTGSLIVYDLELHWQIYVMVVFFYSRVYKHALISGCFIAESHVLLFYTFLW